MVNLVIVSHSALLGQGVGELARQMLRGDGCRIAIAAGIDDLEDPIGTDPIKVMEAIESVSDTDHVLVMMDMGSALLSAETALELLAPDIAQKVRLCAAPLVEGTLAATVSAAAGDGIEKVMQDAQNALQAKRIQLGLPALEVVVQVPELSDLENLDLKNSDPQPVTVIINNPNGLHVRPAARLIETLAGFDAHLLLEKEGKYIKPDSINQIALLQVRCHDKLRLIATGDQAAEALAAFRTLAKENFGEHIDSSAPEKPPAVRKTSISGQVLLYAPVDFVLEKSVSPQADDEVGRLQTAITHTLDDLNHLALLATEKYSDDIAAIFSGHHTLLDDTELFDSACYLLHTHQCSAEWAWYQIMTELSNEYKKLDDAYLQARYIDIEDILHRTLSHLKQITNAVPVLQQQTILVADDIYPSVVVQLDASKVSGIILKKDSPLSHSAFIAREAGILYLSQQGDAYQGLHNGELLMLDNLCTHPR